MAKSIDIKLGTTFDKAGIVKANQSLAKLAQDVGRANEQMRQATLRAEMGVNSYAEAADKACLAAGGGYKTLEQQLAELKTSHAAVAVSTKEVGAAAKAAGDEAVTASVSASDALGAVNGNLGSISKVIAKIGGGFGMMKGMGAAMFSAWGAAIASVLTFFVELKKLIDDVSGVNLAPPDAREASSIMADMKNEAENFADAMKEAREDSASLAKNLDAQVDAMSKLTKAQNEFARAQELASAKSDEDRIRINAKYDKANAQTDADAETAIAANRRKSITDEIARLDAEISFNQKQKKAYEATATRLTDASREYSVGFLSQLFTNNSAKHTTLLNGATNAGNAAFDAQDAIDTATKKRQDLIKQLGVLDKDEKRMFLEQDTSAFKHDQALEAALDTADEKAKKEIEAARKELDAIRAEDERNRLAVVAAEQKAREKMEADLHAQRVADAKAEMQAGNQAASNAQSVASRAQTEFDRAFGMYRSDDHGAAQIAEERDYAADYKRLQKDAARYGGKWRIDELAGLMAAGDTQGQAAKLEEWRKSSSFTPEVESMVRAAAADQTKTTAEDELRKISANTADLAAKLDELLQVK